MNAPTAAVAWHAPPRAPLSAVREIPNPFTAPSMEEAAEGAPERSQAEIESEIPYEIEQSRLDFVLVSVTIIMHRCVYVPLPPYVPLRLCLAASLCPTAATCHCFRLHRCRHIHCLPMSRCFPVSHYLPMSRCLPMSHCLRALKVSIPQVLLTGGPR